MFRKIFFAFIFTLGLLFLYQNKLLAIEGLDIVLQDDTEQKTVTVLVDSKDSNVAGIDMIILFSDDIIIEEITESEDYCRMLFNAFDEDNRLMVECFNNQNVKMNGVLTTFRYSTQNDDYYFYVDQNRLDIGSVTLGSITDINRPGEVQEDIRLIARDFEAEEDNGIVEFLTENSLYVLAGVILSISALLLILGLNSKKKL